MSVIYKTLFTINILHEYFLTTSEGKTVFDEVTPEGRMRFLLNEFSLGNMSVSNDLDFMFPESMQTDYENYGLKILPAYSGCRVAIRVKPVVLSDGSTVYEPQSTLPSSMPIYLLVDKRNNSIDRYSNKSVQPPFPGIQYFPNSNPGNDKIFPSLSAKVGDYDGAKTYEQGELASFGANDIRQFIPGNPNPVWQPVTGSYTNDSDNILLPLRYNFSIRHGLPVSQVEFRLLDPGAQEIFKVSISNIPAEQKVSLDFRAASGAIMKTGTNPAISGKCRLKISGDNGYEYAQNIIFSDLFYSPSRWAVIEMVPVPGDLRYSLQDNNGRILQRKDPNGIVIGAPVFEIPVKSRYTFWRFINNRGRKLKLTPALQDYLFSEDGMLITLKPVALAKNYFLVPGQGVAIKKYLPNPAAQNLKRDSKNRICLDVIVPQSDLFPIII
jgi:hypothetical protein